VDAAWFDADSTRTATYTDIPVGVHAFHIRASNGDGVWDREGIVYNVTQKPFFYQTTHFGWPPSRREFCCWLVCTSFVFARLRHG
jgi:hypothetical protein